MKITDTLVVVSLYNNDISWLKDYTDNYLIYDRSEKASPAPLAGIDPKRIIRSPNVGYNSYDYCRYIVEHYDDLSQCVMFIKGWIFPRHITQEEFDLVCNNKTFTPLLTQNHHTCLPVCYYESGLYYEINDSWYFNFWQHKYFHSYPEFAEMMGLSNPEYLGFAPGGNYIVPRENILKRPRDFYEKCMTFMGYTREPAETHAFERASYEIWK